MVSCLLGFLVSGLVAWSLLHTNAVFSVNAEEEEGPSDGELEAAGALINDNDEVTPDPPGPAGAAPATPSGGTRSFYRHYLFHPPEHALITRTDVHSTCYTFCKVITSCFIV